MWGLVIVALLSSGAKSQVIKGNHEGVVPDKIEVGALLEKSQSQVQGELRKAEVSPVELNPAGKVGYSKAGEKFDRDTLKIDTDSTTIYYWGTYTLKYFWASYYVKKLRPSYSPADSTFILTSVSLRVYNPQNVTCTLWVYDKYMVERYKRTFSLTQGSGPIWFEVPITVYLPLYDTFTVVVYLPTSGSGNTYYNQPTLDATSPIDYCSGYIDITTTPWSWYYLTNYDLRIRAIGHFERIHDVSAWEMVFPTHPYCIAEQETLQYNVYNFGNFDESSVPTTVVFGNNNYNVSPAVSRKSYTPLTLSFVPLNEGFLLTKFWTSLSNDSLKSNDTFPDYYLYVFPKYTTYGQDFDFISSLSGAGWTTFDRDGDSKTWTLYTDISYSHSGWDFAGCVYNPSGNNDWLISPPINVLDTANNSVGAFARSISSNYPESLEVWLLRYPHPDSTIVRLYAGRLPANYVRLATYLDEYRGQTVYLAFVNKSVDMLYLFVDDYFVRQVPLPSNGIIKEEFEEGLVPPGWFTDNNLWVGGTPQAAGVPDNGTGNIFYFLSNSTSGSSGAIQSPRCKRNVTSGFISYRFKYNNYDGNDSLQVYYKIDDGGWTLHKTLYTTPLGWDTVIGGPIYVSKDKDVHYVQFVLVAYADGGNSNIAIDDFEAFDGAVLDVPEVVKPQVFVSTFGRDITLKATGIKKEVQVEVFDVAGRRTFVGSLTGNSETRISNLRKGVYFVRFSGEFNEVRKVVVW